MQSLRADELAELCRAARYGHDGAVVRKVTYRADGSLLVREPDGRERVLPAGVDLGELPETVATQGSEAAALRAAYKAILTRELEEERVSEPVDDDRLRAILAERTRAILNDHEIRIRQLEYASEHGTRVPPSRASEPDSVPTADFTALGDCEEETAYPEHLKWRWSMGGTDTPERGLQEHS